MIIAFAKDCAHHIREGWILLYIERWLTAPFETAEGEQLPRGTRYATRRVVSPILMNLFMHYTFDAWMSEKNPLCRLPVMPMMRWFTAAVGAGGRRDAIHRIAAGGMWADDASGEVEDRVLQGQ